MRTLLALALPLALLAGFAACSDDATSTSTPVEEDAGTDASRPKTDAGTNPEDAGTDAAEPSLPKATEAEPNNGATTTELNAMALPSEMVGKLDPAKDIDIFGVTPAVGEFWEWTLTPSSGELAPHLTVFDTAPSNQNPTRLVAGQSGGPARLDHFVLHAGTFVATVRDTRNVTGGNVGGPGFGYSLVAKKKTVSPVTVTFPSTKSATLASLGAIDLFTFTGSGGKGFDIAIKAERKAAPSTMDSRISLYEVSTKKTLITNDDASGSTPDSQLSSASPVTGTYIVVVENEGTDGADLSYDIEFTLKP